MNNQKKTTNFNTQSPAYTYEDFVKDANAMGNVAREDYDLAMKNPAAGLSIFNAKRQWAAASTDAQRAAANKAAEKIRNDYGGYTMGGAGASFRLGSPSPNNYQAPETPSFSYDMKSDPVYQAYEKQYAREGQRATENALGSAAAATGGIPSSYATTAASQAGNYYASQMADKVPELYGQAYNRYQNELAQYNANRNFTYGQHMDEINYQSQGRQEQLNNAITAAGYGDYSGLQNLGINMGNNPAEYQKKYNEAVLAAQYGDYDKLKNLLGITANSSQVNQNILYSLAAALAQTGDTSYLYQMINKYL